MPRDNFESIRQLYELATDLHWSWNHATDKIWQELDPVLWNLTHNPLVVLQTAAEDHISAVLKDPIVRTTIRELSEQQRQRSHAPAWFQHQHPGHDLSVAYFSMEYMLSEALPIYSGGLGNVSGDLLKTASDLAVPMVAVGLLYQQGYSRQVIAPDGTQRYVAPFNDPGQLPVTPLRSADGRWLRIELALPGTTLWLRSWRVRVGRTELLLLDSNDAANLPAHRGLTSDLYGDDPERRLAQQLILGIGGWRLLKALGRRPQVCHLNESHTAFVVLERAADFMKEQQVPFTTALLATRSGTVFTTHTAVGAGFDRYPRALLGKYLAPYCAGALGISFDELMELGCEDPTGSPDSFNTATLAFRGSGRVNAVSRLHAEVSRALFAPLFPRWPLDEVPLGHVTNGVHVPTWDSPEADDLWTEACGKDRWLGKLGALGAEILHLPGERIWALRTEKAGRFINELRERFTRQLAISGGAEPGSSLFDPSCLTIGFARRFVAYKRPGLLLSDPERLKRLLLDAERPVQLVIAGKAHPSDLQALAVIQDWVTFIRDNGLQQRVVFLADYDMRLTELLVQGVDLWINTPRRPWEACGTSGMKVLVNGGLNLSELDGWWDEAYRDDCGWTFGDRLPWRSDAEHDQNDANRIYEVLEREVVPLFYTRNGSNVPEGWVRKMKASMARLTPCFSSVRALQEYVSDYYLPADSAVRARTAAAATACNEWLTAMRARWPGLRFGATTFEATADDYSVSIEVYLNSISTADIRVELYAEPLEGSGPFRRAMELRGPASGAGPALYAGTVPATRPASDYTARIIPVHSALSLPLECPLILWQR
ncbi:glycosyltransferase family protein [Flaviaesturariibacter terrae]